MKCLMCLQPMKKCAMFGILVDFCSSCKGTWLDKHEFTTIVAMKSEMTKTQLMERVKQEQATEALKNVTYRGLCQRCGFPVSEIEMHGVKVDRCKTCGGVFFEEGELTRCMGNCKREGWFAHMLNLLR